MSLRTCSAGGLPGTDFCFIFAPGGYDEPEILPPQNPSVCLTGPDGEQAESSFDHCQTYETSDFVFRCIYLLAAMWRANRSMTEGNLRSKSSRFSVFTKQPRKRSA